MSEQHLCCRECDPGEEDERGQTFTGYSERLLTRILRLAGEYNIAGLTASISWVSLQQTLRTRKYSMVLIELPGYSPVTLGSVIELIWCDDEELGALLEETCSVIQALASALSLSCILLPSQLRGVLS